MSQSEWMKAWLERADAEIEKAMAEIKINSRTIDQVMRKGFESIVKSTAEKAKATGEAVGDQAFKAKTEEHPVYGKPPRKQYSPQTIQAGDLQPGDLFVYQDERNGEAALGVVKRALYAGLVGDAEYVQVNYTLLRMQDTSDPRSEPRIMSIIYDLRHPIQISVLS